MSDCRSLYVHVPFCRSKCAYCDFNSYAGQEGLIPAYVDALLREAAAWSEAAAETLDTVYLGGGTPSLLPLSQMQRLMTGLRGSFTFAEDAEVSLEANPESVDLPNLRGLRELGFNRLSIGVQSFDDRELRFLGRVHDAATAEAAYAAARQAGFANVSLDLIFGLPGQRPAQWRRSLEKALSLEPEHLSLYALTVEEETPLAKRIAAGESRAPDEDAQAEMYARSAERLAGAGYEHYEISNWARPGRRCRHNLTYWQSDPYLGLGAGAHSYLGDCRFADEKRPDRYIERVTALTPSKGRADGPPVDPAEMPQVTFIERLDAATALADAVILRLRLTEGISLEAFEQRSGTDLEERYSGEIADLSALGLLERVDGFLRLTERGLLLANEAFQRFLP